MNATHTSMLIRGSGLSHRLGVLELIHVTLKLFHILLQLPVFSQFFLQDVHERLERRFGQLVIPTGGVVEGRYGTCGRAVTQTCERCCMLTGRSCE